MKKLGFGGMRLPLLNPEDPASIDQNRLNEMVDVFLAAGFTYFDTAYGYHNGCSEMAFRKALVERHSRDAFLLADKMPTFLVNGPDYYESIFQTQLDRCGVDYFDYYLLHNINRHTYQSTVDFGGFAYMARLKREGRIHHMGFSFHDTPEMLDDILTKYPEMEFVQLQLNYIDWESPIIQARRCYETAAKHGKPVIVMEPVKGGGLADLPKPAEQILKEALPDMSCASWAMRYAGTLDNVIMVLSGMSNLAQTEDNISVMKDFIPLSGEEASVLEKASGIIRKATAIPCTNCRYCVDTCPGNIDIPGYFAIYNTYEQFKTLDHHRFQYERQIVGHGKASECVLCRECESHCPQHIDITSHLKTIANVFEGA